MSNKVELNELTQVTHNESNFLVALNANLKALQQAINDTLSRTGVIPNQMEQVLDMNGHRIINLGAAEESTDAVSAEDYMQLSAKVEEIISRLDNLSEETRQSLQQYVNEYIIPTIQELVKDIEATKDTVLTEAERVEEIYKMVQPIAEYIDNIVQLSLMGIATAGDIVQGTADSKIVTPKALKEAGIVPLDLSDKEGLEKAVKVTLPASDWSSLKTITVAVEGVTDNTPIFVVPYASLENIKAYGESYIYASETGNGTVTFTCETVPSVDIDVLVGVNAVVASVLDNEVIGDINSVLDKINGEVI